MKRLASCLLITILSVLSMYTLSSEKEIPIDDFFEKNTQFGHILSPNGKHLAYIERYPTAYSLSITDLSKKEVIHETRISKKYPRNLSWLSDRRLMFNLDGRVYAANIDGTDLRVIISNIYKSKIRSFKDLRKNYRSWVVENNLPENDEEILVSSRNIKGNMSVHQINVFTGEKKDLYDGDVHNIQHWLLNHEGKVDLAIRTKKDKSFFFNFDDEKKKLIAIKNENTLKFDFSGKSFLGVRAIPVGHSEKKDEIYIIENNSSDRFALYSYNYRTGAKKRVLDDGRYDLGNADDEPLLIYDNQSKALVGVRYWRDKISTVWFDEKLKEIQTEIDSQYPKQVNLIQQWTDDFERILFRSVSDKSFGKVLIFDVKTKRMIVQALALPKIDSEDLSSSTTVSYKARDGHEIEAFLSKPLENNTPVPLIVMPHGGPFARAYYGYNPYTQYFNSRGFAVIEPNFRGSTGYGRDHLTQGKTSIHDVMIDDIRDSVSWAVAENIADPKRIHILGFSYGGYAAVMSAIRYPDVYHSAVSYSAPLNLKKQLNWFKSNDLHFAYEYWKEMVFKDKKRKYVNEISPFYQSEKIAIPLLVFHGEDDKIVPHDHAKDLKNLVEEKKKNDNIKVIVLNDEGHNIYHKSNKIYFAEKALKLFQSEK